MALKSLTSQANFRYQGSVSIRQNLPTGIHDILVTLLIPGRSVKFAKLCKSQAFSCGPWNENLQKGKLKWREFI